VATRILIADDDEICAELTAFLLESAGYQVLFAADGGACQRIALELSPDLIICDLQMPVLSGYELARSLRENRHWRRVPLVAVSGLPVCAPALIKAGLRSPQDLSGQVLIHLTTQPRSWPAWLKEAGIPDLVPRGHLWLDSVPAMLEAAEHGLGVTLAMAPLIKARPGFGKRLVAPFAFEAAHRETIYLVSRTEQARDRRIAAVRRWIVEAVGRAKG